jgi:HEAT repeat protein
MELRLGFTLCALFSVLIPPAVNRTASGPTPDGLSELSTTELASSIACLPESDISTAVQKLSSAQSYSDRDQAQKMLLANANSSPRCRKSIVAALISALDKPNLDLFRDQANLYLWIHGAELLGDLKATEGLNFLISHLDLNDGTSFPLNHHPAVGAVIKMGPVAIPKLAAVLMHSSDRNIRRCAVFCISQIGGPTAVRTLKQAFPSESDQCVRKFIRASINALDNQRLPNHITSQDRTKWYSTFLCNE